jgi:hypothetical protein
MRWLSFLLLIGSLAAGQSTDSYARLQSTHSSAQVNGPASIAGAVVNSLTGKPLDGVHVRLVGLGSDQRPSSLYGAMSNAAGRFSIQAVPSGVYIVLLERRGFIMVPVKNGFAAKGAVELKAGEQLQDVTLAMAPRPVIAGRVSDEYGEAMMGISVDALPLDSQALTALWAHATSDDRGEFRISVPPGKYYLKARNWTTHGDGPAEIRSDGTIESDYVETYYPGVTSTEAATPVEAKPGREIHPEFRLARAPVLSISGVVDGIPETATSVSVSMEWGPDASAIRGGSTGPLAAGFSQAPSDKFQLGHLAPGFYRIFATCGFGETQLQSQVVEVSLVDANVEDMRLTLAPGFELAGSVVWDAGSTPVATNEKRAISLQPVGSLGLRFPPGEVAADGAFTMHNVFPGHYRVLAQPLPEDAFIKTVQLNGAPMPNSVVDLSSGAEGLQLKIVLSARGGQISGKVEDEPGGAPSLFDEVILFPDREEVPTSEELRFSKLGTGGAYAFHGLPPGKYRLLPMSRFTASWRNDLKEDIKRLRSTAEVIEIKEGDAISRNLKIAGGEGSNATPK